MCQTKKCTKCKEEKPIDEFGKSKRTKDGKQHQCKSCVNFQKSVLNSNRIIIEYKEGDSKTCSRCSIEKDVSEFSNCSSNPDGKMYDCKECRKRHHKPKKEGVKIFTDLQQRVCTKCEIIKPFSQFNSNNKLVCGVTSICKKCQKDNRKEVKSRIKMLPILKTCTVCQIEKNLESFVKDISKADGIYSVCKSCTNKQRVDRCRLDPTFKLSNNVRKAITASFINCVKGLYSKNNKTENILKTNFYDFRNSIESQFLNWMTWDNYGRYNGDLNFGFDLDHIIPISYAKTEDEIYLLNHWSNFQPLCSKVNRDEKKAKIFPCTNLELRITFWEDHYEYL